MASPGMMQSGLSRELFEAWCTDPKNGVIIAGYCVEGTLAKSILSEPEEVTSLAGQKLPLRMSVDYISFSAHTDYQQTSDFINQLRPPHVVLVHGEQNEMSRLRAALQREHRARLAVHTPRNTQLLSLTFRGDKTAKVMGSLAEQGVQPGQPLQGILVKRNFNYHILAPSDLNKYTELSMSAVTQRQSLQYGGSPGVLRHVLGQLAGAIDFLSETRWRLYGCVELTLDGELLILEVPPRAGPAGRRHRLPLRDALAALRLRGAHAGRRAAHPGVAGAAGDGHVRGRRGGGRPSRGRPAAPAARPAAARAQAGPHALPRMRD
ncbi:hypothetical protein ACJJTC_019763 [Scirpophaga incertulas]